MKYFMFTLLVHSFISESGLCYGQETRIAGGESIERNSRPFQVALFTKVQDSQNTGFCGGSLVHPQWVITSAHCCFHHSTPVDDIQAVLGAHSLYDRYENGRRIIKVVDIVVHPDWDSTTYSNDLALLKLTNAVQLSDTISVIQLPYRNISNYNFAGMGATSSGWGIPAQGVKFISPTIRNKIMTVMTDTLCNSIFLNELTENFVCGYSLDSGTCKGDNGGPLTIYYTATEETILIGVTSFISANECNMDLPSVFTRVQKYLDWISAVTGLVIL